MQGVAEYNWQACKCVPVWVCLDE